LPTAAPTGDKVLLTNSAGTLTWGDATGAGGAPLDAAYIVQTDNATLTNDQALDTLATGYMKVTNGTGVITSQAVPIPVADGGTGKISWTANRIVYADTATSLSQLGLGTTTTVLHGDAAGIPTWGAVSLTADVSGILPVAKGGTNLSSLGTGNQLLGVNSGATAMEYKTISGTTDRVSVNHGVGTVTLSAPQDIAVTSAPQFARLGLGVAAHATDPLNVSGIAHISGNLHIGGGYSVGGISVNSNGTLQVGSHIYLKGAIYEESVQKLRVANNTIVLNSEGSAQDAFIQVNATAAEIKWDQANTRWDIANSALLRKSGIADVVTQYPSRDLMFQGSGWDTTLTAEAPLISSLRLIAGSGATGSIPYRLAVLDNAGAEFVSFDALNQRVGIGITDPGLYRLNVSGDVKISGKTALGAGSYEYTWPTIGIADSKVLITNASGTLSWGDATGAGGAPETAHYVLTQTAGLTNEHLIQGTTDEIDVSAGVGTLTVGIIDPLILGKGGTSKALTASNGGIVYSDADSMEILAGTATAGRMLRSGASAAPSWSTATYPSTAATAGTILRADGTNWAATTATYPATTAINQILYSSSADVVTGLATGNNGVLVTSAAGIPSIATSIPTAVTIGGSYIYRAGGTDVALADGGTFADLSVVATGGVIYKAATALAGSAALSGIVQGNGSSAPTAITGTANYVPKWSATAPYLTATSQIFDDGTNVGIGIVPSSKFHVNGNVLINSGSVTIDNNQQVNLEGSAGDTYIKRNSTSGEVEFYLDNICVAKLVKKL
ncbi:MAG: hypothetical protein ABH914_01905, partial [Candidatus Omnitrophota bacterium]